MVFTAPHLHFGPLIVLSEKESGQKECLIHFLPSTGIEAGEYTGHGGSGAGLSGWESQFCHLVAVGLRNFFQCQVPPFRSLSNSAHLTGLL